MLEIFCPSHPRDDKNKSITLLNKQNIPLPPIQSIYSSTTTLNNEDKNSQSINEVENSNKNNSIVSMDDNKKKAGDKVKLLDIYKRVFDKRNSSKNLLQLKDLTGFNIDSKNEKYKAIEEFFDHTICHHCIELLEESYSHCLNKVGFFFPSVYEINEEKDSENLADNPEVFICDAELKVNKQYPNGVYISEKHKKDIDQKLILNNKIERKLEGGPGIGIGGYYQLDVTKNGVEEPFPGILVHDLGNKKDKEIQNLKKTILLLKDQLKDEKDTNKDYRRALEKMRKSCLFADTWKNLEESRLKDDIRQMRAQLTAFIAYSFSQEKEKYELRLKNKYLKDEMESKEKEIIRVNKNYDATQIRYNDLMSKYAEINNSVKDLRVAAKNGSLEVQSKNEILNEALRKVSGECKSAQSQLAKEYEKARSLEFELMTLVNQYNELNKEKLNLKNIIQDYIQKNIDLKKTYQDSIDQIKLLKENISRLEHIVENTETQLYQEKKKSNTTKAEMTKSLESCKKEKEIIQLRMEEYLSSLEKITLDYSKAMSDKCRLEDELIFTKKRYKNNMANKTKMITDLQKESRDLKEKVEHYKGENTRLEAIENELRSELDKNSVAVNALKLDLTQTQNTLEELKTKLTDKISKLISSNNELQEENHSLNSKLFNMTKKIEDDERYIEILKNRLKEYDEKNEIKNAIYNTRKIEMYIEEKIAESEEANIQSIKKIENLNEKIETTKVSLQKKEEERAQLEEECKKLKEEINVIKTDPIQIVQVKKKIEEKMVECKDEINLLKKELEDSKTKNNNLNLQFNNYKVSMEHEIEYQKSEKTKLQEHIEELKREAVESRKVLDKVYESYENSKITLEQLLLNNELLEGF
jgi:chromosome segregation ATPase